MSNYDIKAVVQEPYYKCPEWLETVEYKEYIILSKKISNHDVDLFLVELFGYNDIDVDREPKQVFKDLLNEESIVVAGGVLFVENHDKMIFPSCCSGLEGWRENLNGVIEGKSPCMGHDPSPTLEFHGDKVRIWSDDYKGKQNLPNSDIFYIEFDRHDLISKLRNIETDLKEFACSPLYNRVNLFDKTLAEQMIEKFSAWFDLTNN
ncbi:hypothetical protein [Bacillus sp. SA1-12]|uniref:hypothetical protein n=1 Tax=Bacillus sp. SA1-12 TaxID=1455638 RepID=UPI00069852B8|nr:hypothetical protein [Bacillus sp. SA1-12]